MRTGKKSNVSDNQNPTEKSTSVNKSEKLPKNKVGRPRKPFNKIEFEKLCALQCTEEEICGVFGIDPNTLNVNLKEVYGNIFSVVSKVYAQDGKISLRRNQAKLSKRSAIMGIWLGKNYLGQKDIVTNEPDRRLAATEVEILTDDEKNEAAELLSEFTNGKTT